MGPGLLCAPVLASLMPLAVELDFRFFPKWADTFNHSTWIKVAAGRYVLEDPPESPTTGGLGFGPEEMADYCRSSWMNDNGVETVGEGEVFVVTRYKGRPVTKVEYRSTGPSPVIRWVIRPEKPKK